MEKKLFPSLIFGTKDLRIHCAKILEILELDIEFKPEDEIIIVKPPRKNSSKNHKMIYEKFYKIQGGI